METITKAANLKKRIFYCLSIQWNFRVSRHFLKEETWCPRIIYNRHSLQKWEPGYGSLRRIPTPQKLLSNKRLSVEQLSFLKKNGDLIRLIPTVLLLCHIFVDLVKISTVLKGDRLIWCRLIQARLYLISNSLFPIGQTREHLYVMFDTKYRLHQQRFFF